MGPPREHGGMQTTHTHQQPLGQLQWGRRVNTAECAATAVEVINWAKLQWGRRVNTAECDGSEPTPPAPYSASMGPPREHGGMLLNRSDATWLELASMGPPREHGGMVLEADAFRADRQIASMGPPREHGGMLRGQSRY